MVYTNVWDASYEADPSDSGTNVSVGADRIRDTRTDIRERMQKDHYMDIAGTDADHGEHAKVTFHAPLGADPSNVANKGFLYTKDVSSKVELFWEDEDGNTLQLTFAGAVAPPFPSGTVMAFAQNSAPTGWTRLTTGDTFYDSSTDNAMFCFAKSGNIAYGGGVSPKTTHSHTVSGHVHTMGSHLHQIYKFYGSSTSSEVYNSSGTLNTITLAGGNSGIHILAETCSGGTNMIGENLYTSSVDLGDTGSAGSGSTGSNTAPYYVELILAKKD